MKKKPLTIEINGTGTRNRGAELMAIAIAERLRSIFPGVRLAVTPRFGSFEARARYGFWTTWELGTTTRSRFVRRLVRTLMPSMGETVGLLHPREVDIVLDASGFSFSDQWGPKSARLLLQKMSHTDRKRAPLVLLSQAFGPFDVPEVAKWSRALFERASLICVRDSSSHEYMKRLGVEATKLFQYPDFTLAVKSLNTSEIEVPSEFTAIVPNYRMIDKGNATSDYLNFLSDAIAVLERRGLKPLFVLHDAKEDRRVIQMILAKGVDIPVIEASDPLVLKSVLGRATLVVGSRFHALVSSLSQGVPCIALGWSHKYPELFSDFDCSDLLVKKLETLADFERILNFVETAEAREVFSKRILIASSHMRKAIEQMWLKVELVIRELDIAKIGLLEDLESG